MEDFFKQNTPQSILKKEYYLLLRWLGAIWLLCISHAGFSALGQVTAVRLRSLTNCTRITIESTKIVRYRQFIFKKPKRIVLDIKGVKLNLACKKPFFHIRRNNPYIKSALIKQFDSKTVRLIFLPRPNVKLHIFTLAPADKFNRRLVIDLYKNNNINTKKSFLILVNKNKQNQKKRSIPFWMKKKLNLEQSSCNHHRPIVIMLDPGHGGEDFGAIGKYKTREKDVVLQIAYRLEALIKCENNMRVYMTRNKDIFVPLNVRVKKAQKRHTDLLISIHADAFTNRQASGSSVFTLSNKGASSIASRYLSDIQNTSAIIGRSGKKSDRYVANTMFDMIQTLTMTNSLHFGKVVLARLGNINKLHKNSVEQAGFAILKSPNIPSILVEAAFISNVKEERKLKTAKFQQEIAESIMKGIKTYILCHKTTFS